MIALYAGIASGAVVIAIPEVHFDEENAIKRFAHARQVGKRGMIGVFAEGMSLDFDHKYSEDFVKKLEARTGIETKFARFAHVVRGGDPTLRDRLTASRMGVRAVELLLEGKSNLVVCEIDGKITDLDINYALIADRNYKNKLKPGDLEKFSAEQVNAMKALATQRHEEMLDVYRMVAETSK
jgi:6-phosphofructokinase 1